MAGRWAEMNKARRSGNGSKPDQGPGDLVKADRDAGPNIHRDDWTWTVATPEEFRRGSNTERSGRSKRSTRNDKKDLQQEVSMLLGGRRKKYAADMIYEDDAPWRKTRSNHPHQVGGHGAKTYSEQFTEPEDASRAFNSEEAALLRERDRLDPYGKPTHKMRVQDSARGALIDEYFKRRGGRR